ncbi:MAG: hypothetical protein ACKE5M_03450 [Methylophilaceae bacterium]
MIKFQPDVAWQKYILGSAHLAGWMEDSKPISSELLVSKRELFSLIILAHIKNHIDNNNNWIVGYDTNASEPNDGFVSDGNLKIDVEHKIIPQMNKQDPLDAILSTYGKYASKGVAYGGDRTLIIHANIQTKGLIKISSLKDKISGACPFDRVLLMSAVAAHKNNIIPIHITEHYPSFGIAQVDFNLLSGEATIPHYGIK